MASHLSTWETLSLKVQQPQSRAATSYERLFGEEEPLLRLWHDSACWSPNCAGIRMILEEMRIPHTLKTISLHNYRAPGEPLPQEFIDLAGFYGRIPVLQLALPECGGSSDIQYGPAVQMSYPIAALLANLFPDNWLMPRTTRRRAFALSQLALVERLELTLFPLLQAIAEGTEPGELERMEDEFIVVMDAIAAGFERPLPEDDADGNVANFGGRLDDGPFLFGSKPSAVDFLLLPLLERVEAWVPHPLVGNRPELLLETRWPLVSDMLTAARKPGACPSYSEFGTDAETLVGMAMREMESGRCRKPGFISGILCSELESYDELCKKAIARHSNASAKAAAVLCSNHAAVARFCLRGMGVGRFWPDEGKQAVTDIGAATFEAMDSSLRFVTSLLLSEPSSLPDLQASACVLADHWCSQHGRDCAERVVQGLKFLSWNVSVPRDMPAPAAQALRANVRLVAARLEKISGDKTH